VPELAEGIAAPPVTDAGFRALFESSPTAMAILDIGRRIRLANLAMSRLLGRSPAELVGLTIYDVTHPDDLRESHARARTVDAGGAVDWEKRYVRPDGTIVWGHVTANSWRGPDDAHWVLAVIQDVTNRKHAESALAEREAEFSELFQEAPFPMAVNLPQGRFVRVNRALCELVGYTPKELLEKNWLDLVDPLDRDASRANDERERRGEVSERDVVRRILTKDGTSMFLRCKAHVVRHDSGAPRYWVGQFVDLTPARRHEEERLLLTEHLRQSQRTEAVGRVAGGVVHDFNNMLAVILNVAELARMRSTDPRTREYTEQIHSAAMRAAALSRRLMSFGRRDAVPPELLDLNALIAENRHLLQRVTSEDISFVTELTQPLAAICIGRAQLEQVLLNLAVNARDAMPLGGRLIYRTGHRLLATPEFGLPVGEYVTLEVEDTGTGIPDDLVAQVFVPFFTTKEDGRGTGLGLSIVQHVVTSGGGAVQLRTELGVGTTFLILLPAAKMPLSLEPSMPAGQVAPGRGERILVVEDELTLLDLTTQVLAENGYVPLAAPGAEPALELVRQMRNRVDLLLTDVVMPGMSGTELAARVRETHPETRVLFMSGHPDDRLARHASSGQIHALMRKPFRSIELLAAIRRVLDAPGDP
jgi:two-component system cell cycle sensor histidine kinase/response regulator CckA